MGIIEDHQLREMRIGAICLGALSNNNIILPPPEYLFDPSVEVILVIHLLHHYHEGVRVATDGDHWWQIRLYAIDGQRYPDGRIRGFYRRTNELGKDDIEWLRSKIESYQDNQLWVNDVQKNQT